MRDTELKDALNDAARRAEFASLATLALAEQSAFEVSAETWGTLAEYTQDVADRLRAVVGELRAARATE